MAIQNPKKTLFLAAGHGGTDMGNTAVAGVVEREETIQILDGIYDWSRAANIKRGVGGIVWLDDVLEVVNDKDLLGQIDLMKKWKANRHHGDLGVDIHLDYRPSGGAMAIVDNDPRAKAFAEGFLRRWCTLTKIKNNGVVDSKWWARHARKWGPNADMGWCRPPEWAGVVLELCSLNIPWELALVRNPTMQHKAGEFIWEAFNEV